MEANSGPSSVDAYIAAFPDDVQAILKQIRALIREVAPEAEERIAYRMPGYYLNGPLVYFAGFKRHIGLYPTGADLGPLEAELAGYKRSKGTIQFPLDKPIPYDLIRRVVSFRLGENLAGAKTNK